MQRCTYMTLTSIVSKKDTLCHNLLVAEINTYIDMLTGPIMDSKNVQVIFEEDGIRLEYSDGMKRSLKRSEVSARIVRFPTKIIITQANNEVIELYLSSRYSPLEKLKFYIPDQKLLSILNHLNPSVTISGEEQRYLKNNIIVLLCFIAGLLVFVGLFFMFVNYLVNLMD